MKSFLSPFVAVLFFMASVQFAGYSEEPLVLSLREESGIDAWPNKQGPLKKGVKFATGEHQRLTGLVKSVDEVDIVNNLGAVRSVRFNETLTFARTSRSIDLRIGVANGSNPNSSALTIKK